MKERTTRRFGWGSSWRRAVVMRYPNPGMSLLVIKVLELRDAMQELFDAVWERQLSGGRRSFG